METTFLSVICQIQKKFCLFSFSNKAGGTVPESDEAVCDASLLTGLLTHQQRAVGHTGRVLDQGLYPSEGDR